MPLFDTVDPVIVMFEFGPLNTSMPTPLNWNTEWVATSFRSRMPLRPMPESPFTERCRA